MRSDMAKVVTEKPRRGSRWRNEKFGGRVRLTHDHDEYTDYGHAGVIGWSRRRNGERKDFTDVLGPLRGYLRKQVGRPWDAVWSEICATLDNRSLTGQHIFTHIAQEVEEHCWMGVSGKVYPTKQYYWRGSQVTGLYVHPMTRLLCWNEPHSAKRAKHRQKRWVHFGLVATFGLVDRDVADAVLNNFRIDGMTVWQRRDGHWFIITYADVPAREEVRVGYDGLAKTVIIAAHRACVSTKQASKKELRAASALLMTVPV